MICRRTEDAEIALGRIRGWVERNGLSLHPAKTQVVNCAIEGQGFDFLGYHFEAGRRWVRKKSLKALRDKVRSKTRRTCGQSLTQVIKSLNPMLRGWFGYFKHAESYVFKSVDGFVRRRLRAILRKQSRRPGVGKCLADHIRWPNAFFAKHDLFIMTQARAEACQSRW